MIIRYEKEIKSCWECPFTQYSYDPSFGINGMFCRFSDDIYTPISKEEFKEDCPFKNGPMIIKE